MQEQKSVCVFFLGLFVFLVRMSARPAAGQEKGVAVCVSPALARAIQRGGSGVAGSPTGPVFCVLGSLARRRMNEFSHVNLPTPCRFGKHPPAPGKKQPANEGRVVEDVEGQTRLGFPCKQLAWPGCI